MRIPKAQALAGMPAKVNELVITAEFGMFTQCRFSAKDQDRSMPINLCAPPQSGRMNGRVP